MNHVQQRDVFERARHRDVVVESLEGPLEDLDRCRTLKTFVHRFEFIEEVSGRRNQGHLLSSLTFSSVLLGYTETSRTMTTTPLRTSTTTDHLDLLESHAIFILREVVAECERPVLLFSGGKDSAVLLHLAVKAFQPNKLPFPIMHVDTGHNFPEVIGFRDEVISSLGERLIVARVQDSIDAGRVVDPGPEGSRNRLQTVTLLDAINEHRFDAAFGGARRDEDKARAKERVLSFRDAFGQWEPRRQRPELWQLYQGKVSPGEHLRCFPLSDWTELDIWQYIEREAIALPSIYYAHKREVVERDRMLLAVS